MSQKLQPKICKHSAFRGTSSSVWKTLPSCKHCLELWTVWSRMIIVMILKNKLTKFIDATWYIDMDSKHDITMMHGYLRSCVCLTNFRFTPSMTFAWFDASTWWIRLHCCRFRSSPKITWIHLHYESSVSVVVQSSYIQSDNHVFWSGEGVNWP